MKIYKMLIINRIREYIRLVKNMYIQIFGLLVFFAIIIGMIGKDFAIMIMSMRSVNLNVFWTIILCVFVINLCRIFRENLPKIVIKPMTLFLLDIQKINKIFIMKYLYYILKYSIMALFLTFCTCGISPCGIFCNIFLLYFMYLFGTFLISWNLYHSQGIFSRCCLRSIFMILTTIAFVSSFFNPIIYIGILAVIGLFMYTIFCLKLNYSKYEEDIKYLERIMVAQNNNNTILLNQYSKEKMVRNISKSNHTSFFLKKWPLIWKAFVSINRIGRLPIIIGMVCFGLAFMVYTVPIFEKMPAIEIVEVRYIFLIFGIFTLVQLSVQTFVKQLTDFVDKQNDGLYIPIDKIHIVLQFSLIPVLFILIISIILSFLLKSRICLSIVFCIVMAMYVFITMYLTISNKKLLDKIYTILSIGIFLISNILLF